MSLSFNYQANALSLFPATLLLYKNQALLFCPTLGNTSSFRPGSSDSNESIGHLIIEITHRWQLASQKQHFINTFLLTNKINKIIKMCSMPIQRFVYLYVDKKKMKLITLDLFFKSLIAATAIYRSICQLRSNVFVKVNSCRV